MSRWKTAIVGFGRIAAGYSDDPAHRRWFGHASHAAILKAHAAFDWSVVIDPGEGARQRAREQWRIGEVVADAALLVAPRDIEVAVLATPPDQRLAALSHLTGLRAVLVEKPLGTSLGDAEAFLRYCREREILVAVNLPRRYDRTCRALAEGELTTRVGRPTAVFGTYGNGLRNNGTHLIDLIRMLLGPIASSDTVSGDRAFVEGPIAGDVNVAFSLALEHGVIATVQPLPFTAFREVGLDVWGERGRLQLQHEGLTEIFTPVADNRQLTGARELAHDRTSVRQTSLGSFFERVYDNLSAALANSTPLMCSGGEALETMRIVEQIAARVAK